MKIILAPTDFSKTARNAVNYAAEIAEKTHSKLVLLHAYHSPVIIAEAPVVLPLPAELEKDCNHRLKRLRLDLITRYGRKLDIDTVCLDGLAVDVITRYATDKQADLIVVGTHGAGYLEEKLLGSVASELIKTPATPVLSIATKVKFKSVKKIVLATDYQELKSKISLDALKDIARVFKSHLYILNIATSTKPVPSADKIIKAMKLQPLLSGQKHSFHTEINKDIVSGINEFAKANSMDMIVMFPRSRQYLQAIFKKRNSKAMAFHTETPLLTIHS